jgi:hypothetical protein
MTGFFKKLAKSEKGQGLPMALVMLLVGALLVSTSSAYMTTSLKAKIVAEDKLKELYAADAGVEYTLWCLKEGMELDAIPSSLPSPVSGKPVTLAPVESIPSEVVPSTAGDYYRRYWLYGHPGHWEIDEGTHTGVLSINTTVEYRFGYNYKYVITVTNDTEEVVPLVSLACRLPIRFLYFTCLTYPDNITYNYPTIGGYGGPYWTQELTWALEPPVMIAPGETRQQIFDMVYDSIIPPPFGYPPANAPPSTGSLTYYTLGSSSSSGDVLVITAEAGNTTLKVSVVDWFRESEIEGWEAFFPYLSQFSILSWEYK